MAQELQVPLPQGRGGKHRHVTLGPFALGTEH